jgi:hypothetical protein
MAGPTGAARASSFPVATNPSAENTRLRAGLLRRPAIGDADDDDAVFDLRSIEAEPRPPPTGSGRDLVARAYAGRGMRRRRVRSCFRA